MHSEARQDKTSKEDKRNNLTRTPVIPFCLCSFYSSPLERQTLASDTIGYFSLILKFFFNFEIYINVFIYYLGLDYFSSAMLLSVNNVLFMDVPVFFIHSPIEGHLGYFQVVAIMNKAAVSICVQIFVWTSVFNSFG